MEIINRQILFTMIAMFVFYSIYENMTKTRIFTYTIFFTEQIYINTKGYDRIPHKVAKPAVAI